MEEINENELLDPVAKWNNILNKMEDFLYDLDGIITKASYDENLESYNFDIDYVIEIIKELANFQKEYGLTSEQEDDLKQLREEFLAIANNENDVHMMYQDMKRIYENIEEY